MRIFFPVASKTADLWSCQAMELVKEIGKCIADITDNIADIHTLFIFSRMHFCARG